MGLGLDFLSFSFVWVGKTTITIAGREVQNAWKIRGGLGGKELEDIPPLLCFFFCSFLIEVIVYVEWSSFCVPFFIIIFICIVIYSPVFFLSSYLG